MAGASNQAFDALGSIRTQSRASQSALDRLQITLRDNKVQEQNITNKQHILQKELASSQAYLQQMLQLKARVLSQQNRSCKSKPKLRKFDPVFWTTETHLFASRMKLTRKTKNFAMSSHLCSTRS